MTGAEHYLEAERLLAGNVIRGDLEEGHHDYAGDRPSHGDHTVADCEGLGNLAAAQVHATLAVAAAQIETAYAVATKGEDGAIRTDWVEATS